MNNGLKEILNYENTEICYYPANAIHLFQLADYFVVQKIKDAWNKQWEQKNAELLRKVGDSGTFGTK